MTGILSSLTSAFWTAAPEAAKALDSAAQKLGAHTDNDEPWWLWAIFAVIVLVSLLIDLGAHNKSSDDSTKQAAIWSCIWIGTAVIFGLAAWPLIGAEHVSAYFTAYLLEKSLSVDNLFVFLVIFSFFGINTHQQRRVLFWGIMGALFMRALFIFLGVEALLHFKALFYLFGIFLVFTGVKLFKGDDDEVKPEENFFYKLALKHLPICDSDSTHFFHVENGRRMVTKLFVVLIVIETTDLMFAVDSIPAVVAVSQDMFVVYTSNIFAILGLRALYFLLAGIMKHLRYLNLGLGVVLSFIGVKMIVGCPDIDVSIPFAGKSVTIPGIGFEIPSTVSLAIIACIIGTAIAASLIAQKRHPEAAEESEKPAAEEAKEPAAAKSSDAAPAAASHASSEEKGSSVSEPTATEEEKAEKPEK